MFLHLLMIYRASGIASISNPQPFPTPRTNTISNERDTQFQAGCNTSYCSDPPTTYIPVLRRRRKDKETARNAIKTRDFCRSMDSKRSFTPESKGGRSKDESITTNLWFDASKIRIERVQDSVEYTQKTPANNDMYEGTGNATRKPSQICWKGDDLEEERQKKHHLLGSQQRFVPW